MCSHLERNLASGLLVLAIVIAVVQLPAESGVSASSPTQYAPAIPLIVSQSCPSGIAVDTTGTIYWVNRCSGQLLKLVNGASFSSEVLSGLNDPYGVGVDAAGNIYFDEYFKGTLSRLTPGSSSPQVLLTGLSYPNYISVDASGDVYVITGETCGGTILRFDATSHAVTTLLTAPQPPSTGHGFGGVYVDPSGNLYYTTCGNSTLNLLPSGSSAPSTILNTTTRPSGIVVDRTGDVFYALYNSSVDELVAGSNVPIVLTTQGSSHLQLALDQSGNLYFTDDVGGRIWEVPAQNAESQNVTVSTTLVSTLTSTLLSTSILPTTILRTSISSNTQTVTVSVPPSTTTITSLASITRTNSEAYVTTNKPTTQTQTQMLTSSIRETTTVTTILTQSPNAQQFTSWTLIGLTLAGSILVAFMVFLARKRSTPKGPQLPMPVHQTETETIDGIIMKYVGDHGGKISISTACADLGISEPQLRESLDRLIRKGSLSKQ